MHLICALEQMKPEDWIKVWMQYVCVYICVYRMLSIFSILKINSHIHTHSRALNTATKKHRGKLEILEVFLGANNKAVAPSGPKSCGHICGQLFHWDLWKPLSLHGQNTTLISFSTNHHPSLCLTLACLLAWLLKQFPLFLKALCR